MGELYSNVSQGDSVGDCGLESSGSGNQWRVLLNTKMNVWSHKE